MIPASMVALAGGAPPRLLYKSRPVRRLRATLAVAQRSTRSIAKLDTASKNDAYWKKSSGY